MDPQISPITSDLASQSSDPILPKHRGNKIFLLLVVIIVLLLLSGGMYFLGQQSQPKPVPLSASPLASPVSQVDEISGWKTYDANGITFKYPPDYKVWEIAVEANNLSLGVGEESAGNDWTIGIKANTESQEGVVANIKNIPDVSTLKVVSDKPVTFLSLPAREIIIENTPGGSDGYLHKDRSKIIVFTRGNLTYVLSTQFESSTFDQILSTFEFVDNQATMTDWETYTNTKYSISFPQSWSVGVGLESGEDIYSKATPETAMVDISSDPKRPYPNGVITIQVLDSMPTYDATWTKTLTTVNNLTATKYDNSDALDGPSVVYVFQSSPGAKYIEVLFRASKEDTIYKTFEEIINTFTFTQ